MLERPFVRLQEPSGSDATNTSTTPNQSSWRSFITSYRSTPGSMEQSVEMGSVGAGQSNRNPFADSQGSRPASRSCATVLTSIRSHAPSRHETEKLLAAVLLSSCVALATTTGVFFEQRNAARNDVSAARDAASAARVAASKGREVAQEILSLCADKPELICREILDLVDESGLLGGGSSLSSTIVGTEEIRGSDATSMMDVD